MGVPTPGNMDFVLKWGYGPVSKASAVLNDMTLWELGIRLIAAQ